MKCLKLKNHFATIAVAALSITACKKNDVLLPAVQSGAAPDSIAIFELRTATSAANILYISPLGNDATGTGTAASPWKTLFKATSSVATPGSVIHVNAGTYAETQQCLLKPGVSIEGDGVTSIIKSALKTKFTSLLFLSSASEGTNGDQHISKLKFDGQNLNTAWGISIVARSNVSIYNCTVINFREVGVNFSGITSQNGYLPPVTYATGNSFYNNTVTNCSTNDSVYGRGCMQFGGQNGMRV